MLYSLSLVLLIGFLGGKLFEKIKLPPLIGMILVGMLIGPNVLDIIDEKFLNISSELRKIALIIILIRAGLSLKFDDLRKVGGPAILMCFVPAILEIVAMLIFAPILFGLNIIDSLLLGTVIAAVSPAVIVPQMIKVIDSGYGVKRGIPQMILAGASADDVFVIALFTSILGLRLTGNLDLSSIINIPVSIITGILIGFIVGFVIIKILEKSGLSIIFNTLIIFCTGLLLSESEIIINKYFGFSSLLSIMTMGMTITYFIEDFSKNISSKFSEMWDFAQILLFVLLGMAVDMRSIGDSAILAILLIFLVLMFRLIGVYLSVSIGSLSRNEKIFAMISYIPKATVQAAIGGIPLAMGLESGSLILTISVISILFTAPIGSILIDKTYRKLLKI